MKLIQKLSKVDELYFTNDFEDAVIWYSKKDGYFVKFKGKSEFPQVHSSQIVFDGLCDNNEISKKEYEDFK